MPVLKNARHEIFALSIASGKSATEAMLAAGYSPSTARDQANRLSGNVGILSRIVEIRSGIVERSSADAALVLARLLEQTNADILEIQDDQGNFKPMSEWPIYWRRMVQGLEWERKSVRSQDGVQAGDSKSWDKTGDLVVKVKFIDRLKNLELLGRHKAVDAFVQQQKGTELHLHLHAQVESRLARAREIAAMNVDNAVVRTN